VRALARVDRGARPAASPFRERRGARRSGPPALTFAVAVAAAYALGWIVSEPGSSPKSSCPFPSLRRRFCSSSWSCWSRRGLHLTAAVATLSVILASVEFDDGIALRDRGGVSETVQVVAYASSPMALAGPPIPELRVVCGAYAAVLLLIGFRIVHGTTLLRTLVAGVPPALLGYGVGYRVFAAVRTLIG